MEVVEDLNKNFTWLPPLSALSDDDLAGPETISIDNVDAEFAALEQQKVGELLDAGVDGMEVLEGNSLETSNINFAKWQNWQFCQFCRQHQQNPLRIILPPTLLSLFPVIFPNMDLVLDDDSKMKVEEIMDTFRKLVATSATISYNLEPSCSLLELMGQPINSNSYWSSSNPASLTVHASKHAKQYVSSEVTARKLKAREGPRPRQLCRTEPIEVQVMQGIEGARGHRGDPRLCLLGCWQLCHLSSRTPAESGTTWIDHARSLLGKSTGWGNLYRLGLRVLVGYGYGSACGTPGPLPGPAAGYG
ncbi:hypothetical protein BU15DRAFT_65317 [Melanogaster broomeanus]|nr:hypothetical protein BU15DRAFT_65317 [Melanogaster broomeanus]